MTTDPRLAASLADRYTIERELGAGGMATVYLALDLKHQRKVALKVLKPELAAVLGAERFVQEITTTAALQHPQILPLFDSGSAAGFLYYVMPFIDGETLRAKLDREKQLGVEQAVQITAEVADALDYAHRHGVIHRDIKPENILLHDGRPTVADFGIALAVSAAAGGRMTETGLSLGTPHYMSPEQATADRDLTNRSDIYSLASVLYEMLAGNPPHVGASAQQIIMKIVTEDAAPVTRVRRSVPPNVAAAVAKALAKLPADRFATAKEFAEALTDPTFADPAGSPVMTGRWKPALVGGILLGVLAGAAGGRMLSPRAVVAAAEASREQVTFHGRAERPAISPAGDYLAYVDTRCEHAGVGRCRSALVVQEPGSTQPRTLIADALSLDTPRWTHDGRTVIVAGQLDGEREGLFAVSRLSATAQLIGPRGAYDTHPAGDTVLVIPARRGDAGIGLLISLPGGSVVDSIPLPFGAVTDVSWSPDGRHLAANAGRRLQIVDRSGRRTADLPTSTRATIRWTTTGRGLLYFRTGPVREDQFVRLPVDREGRIDGPATIVLDRIATLYRGEFDIARGTGRMLIGTGDATTDLWSFDLGARPVTGRRETRGTTWFGNPELSADGRLLYYYRGDALGDNVYHLDRKTDRETALTVQRFPGGNALRLAADGKRLAYVHTTETTPRLEVITLPSGRVTGASADIDDMLAVPVPPSGYLAQSSDGILQVADSLGGRWRALGIPDSLRITRFDLSPEGTRAVFVATANDISFAPGADRTRNGRRVLMVGMVSLVGDTVRMIRQLDAEEASPSIGWSRDGTINLGRWLAADERPSLWRLSPTDGRLERTADLPVGCRPDSIRLSADGRTGTCTAEDFRSDVWFVGAEETRR